MALSAMHLLVRAWKQESTDTITNLFSPSWQLGAEGAPYFSFPVTVEPRLYDVRGAARKCITQKTIITGALRLDSKSVHL